MFWIRIFLGLFCVYTALLWSSPKTMSLQGFPRAFASHYLVCWLRFVDCVMRTTTTIKWVMAASSWNASLTFGQISTFPGRETPHTKTKLYERGYERSKEQCCMNTAVHKDHIVHIDEQSFGAFWKAKHFKTTVTGSWVDGVFTTNELLQGLNGFEPRPTLLGDLRLLFCSGSENDCSVQRRNGLWFQNIVLSILKAYENIQPEHCILWWIVLC